MHLQDTFLPASTKLQGKFSKSKMIIFLHILKMMVKWLNQNTMFLLFLCLLLMDVKESGLAGAPTFPTTTLDK